MKKTLTISEIRKRLLRDLQDARINLDRKVEDEGWESKSTMWAKSKYEALIGVMTYVDPSHQEDY